MNHKKRTGKRNLCGVVIFTCVVFGALFLAGLRLIGTDLFSHESKAEGISKIQKAEAKTELSDADELSVKEIEAMENREIPLIMQWDERWADKEYGGGLLAETGCGPTCLSMVKTGLSKVKKWTPYKVAKKAEKEGFYVEGQGSSWELMTRGTESFGLSSSEVIFDKAHIIRTLQAGNPIICSMRAGDFTTTGHFLVLAGVSEDGMIIVNDPNSYVRSNKLWDLDTLMPQIRNLWSFENADV